MAKNKSRIKASEEQLEKLYQALKAGTPIMLSLQYARISRSTFYYWVAMASVVQRVQEQEELEAMEMLTQSGVSLQDVRDIAESVAANKKTSVGAFIEPSEETVLQYKNNRKFRKFADCCFDIINECNAIRSGVAVNHLATIVKSTDKSKRINASGSMWFLERNYSEFFSKPNEKAAENVEGEKLVEKIKVEFVDPNTQETKDRVKDMEEDLLASYKEGGRA